MTSRKAKASAKSGQLISPMYPITVSNPKRPTGFVTGYPLSITKGVVARPKKATRIDSLVSKTVPGRVRKDPMY